jgi:transposase-like protein
MRGVERCEESTGRMKKHRYSREFKVTAVSLALPDGPGELGRARVGQAARGLRRLWGQPRP